MKKEYTNPQVDVITLASESIMTTPEQPNTSINVEDDFFN